MAFYSAGLLCIEIKYFLRQLLNIQLRVPGDGVRCRYQRNENILQQPANMHQLNLILPADQPAAFHASSVALKHGKLRTG